MICNSSWEKILYNYNFVPVEHIMKELKLTRDCDCIKHTEYYTKKEYIICPDCFNMLVDCSLNHKYELYLNTLKNIFCTYHSEFGDIDETDFPSEFEGALEYAINRCEGWIPHTPHTVINQEGVSESKILEWHRSDNKPVYDFLYTLYKKFPVEFLNQHDSTTIKKNNKIISEVFGD